jgi:uncharacterized protein YjbI with pentapeptide repeats
MREISGIFLPLKALQKTFSTGCSHFRGYNDGKLTSAKIGFCWEIKVMANQKHLDKLKEGVEAWNQWRREHPDIQPDLSGANLNGAKLSEIDLSGVQLKESTLREVDLSWADLSQTNLYYANLNRANLSKADLHEAALIGANLNEADLSGANLNWAVLIGAQLEGVNLTETYLSRADLTGANLSRANLITATLVQTNLSEANLTGCFVHGTSVWSVQMKDTIQPDLVITFPGEPAITVDNLEIAQFIYLLLNNERIRQVIDTITSKVVLILGRFTDERKKVLDALRNELRKHGYLPVLFDFEKPVSRDFTETVRTLADLSRFIIADLTDPSSIPQELQAIVPDLEVPVQPLLLEAKREYSMFVDFRKYHWVLPVYLYKDQASLIASLKNEIIEPADKKARELAVEKAKRLERS